MDALLDKQITYLSYSGFIDRESIVLKNNFFNFRKVLKDIFNLADYIFGRAQAVLVPMKRLRMDGNAAAGNT